MHYPGRSEILDELFEHVPNPEHPDRYDIRSLSNEIMLRSNRKRIEWQNTDESTITMQLDPDQQQYDTYELFVKEKNDTDCHYYVYNSVAKTIRYEYPFGTWHPKEKAEDLTANIERLLLSGPVHDKVPHCRIEDVIQKSFSFMMGKFVLNHFDELDHDFKIEMYTQYIVTNEEDVKKDILRQLYDRSIELSRFTIGQKHFEYAASTDIALYRIQQKQLLEKAETTEVE